MDELSIMNFAGTTSSSGQAATISDLPGASTVPRKGDKFAAALRTVASDGNDALVNEGTREDVPHPVDGIPLAETPTVVESDDPLVWAINEEGFVAADLIEPLGDSGVLPASIAVALTLPSVGDETLSPLITEIVEPHSEVVAAVPQTLSEATTQRSVTVSDAAEVLDAGTTKGPVTGAPLSSRIPVQRAGHVSRAAALPTTEQTALVLSHTNDRSMLTTDVPLVPTSPAQTVATGMKLREQNVPLSQTSPSDATQATLSSAADRVPTVLTTLPGAATQLQTASTSIDPGVHVSSSERESTRLTPLPAGLAMAPTGAPEPVSAGPQASVVSESPSLLPNYGTLGSGDPRPFNVTVDPRSVHMPTPTATADGLFRAPAAELSVVPSHQGSGVSPVSLPSGVVESGQSPQVSSPQPLTSQVLVAMAQNLSVVREQSSGTLTLRLDPPELGEMEVRFRQGQQGVELRLAARVPGTLQMLVSRGDEISRALSSMELDFSKLEIAGEDSFRSGDESAAYEHRSPQHENAEQQHQDSTLGTGSDDDDHGRRSDGTRRNSQVRRRSGIRA